MLTSVARLNCAVWEKAGTKKSMQRNSMKVCFFKQLNCFAMIRKKLPVASYQFQVTVTGTELT